MHAWNEEHRVEHKSAMNNCYTRIVTALMDLDVLMDDAQRFCTDPGDLAYMTEVYRRANRLDRSGLPGDTKSHERPPPAE